jgi:hypothetical protein
MSFQDFPTYRQDFPTSGGLGNVRDNRATAVKTMESPADVSMSFPGLSTPARTFQRPTDLETSGLNK